MSIQKIESKLRKKGVTTTLLYYSDDKLNGGYFIELSSISEDKIYEKNSNFKWDNHFQYLEDVFEWIKTIPNIKGK